MITVFMSLTESGVLALNLKLEMVEKKTAAALDPNSAGLLMRY